MSHNRTPLLILNGPSPALAWHPVAQQNKSEAEIALRGNDRMTISEILNELEPYTGRFPMKAMKAAIEQREAMTPELLRVVEAVAENPEQHARRENHMLHLFAL